MAFGSLWNGATAIFLLLNISPVKSTCEGSEIKKIFTYENCILVI